MFVDVTADIFVGVTVDIAVSISRNRVSGSGADSLAGGDG